MKLFFLNALLTSLWIFCVAVSPCNGQDKNFLYLNDVKETKSTSYRQDEDGNCICGRKKDMYNAPSSKDPQIVTVNVTFEPALKSKDSITVYFKDSLDNVLIAFFQDDISNVKTESNGSYTITCATLNKKFVARTGCKNFHFEIELNQDSLNATTNFFPPVACKYKITFNNYHDCASYSFDDTKYLLTERIELLDQAIDIQEDTVRKAALQGERTRLDGLLSGSETNRNKGKNINPSKDILIYSIQ